jgi:Coenzyme PQQ synthesis protein D (PqqD)
VEQRPGLEANFFMSREIPIRAESVVSWSDAPVGTEVDREVVLMNVGRGRCYGLGETGSSVWRRLGSPIRVDDLCRELMLEYHADPEMLRKDVLALLEQLQEEGLVKVVAP